MELSQLRAFLAAAQYENMTRAAESLHVTQPALSRTIARLEQELGVQLFEKSGRNTTLTAFGKDFLACAERTLGTLDAGVDAIKRSAAGEGMIRLGFVRPLGIKFIPRLAAEFLKENPEKNIGFTFSTDVTGKLLDGMKEEQYDLSLIHI